MDRSEPFALEQVFRGEYGRTVATLVRRFGDIDIAEEAVQEAFAIATEKCRAGVPHGPPRRAAFS